MCLPYQHEEDHQGEEDYQGEEIPQGEENNQGEEDHQGEEDNQGEEDHQGNHCPTCNREYSRENFILKDGPANSFFELSCNHWQCIQCWDEAFEAMQYHCPFCNENLEYWLVDQYSNSPRV